MNNFILYIFLSLSFLYSQYEIRTNQYSFYKTNSTNEIDFSQIIQDINGKYIVELIEFSDFDFKKNKRVLIESCDLKFNINNNNGKIDINRCSDMLSYDGKLLISDEDYIINIDSQKYEYLNGNFIFWISGNFSPKIDSANSLEDGILREYYDNGKIYLEYSYDNGKKHGIQKRWYEDGQLEMIYNYYYGKLDGLQKKWHSNGRIKGEWHYKDDKLHGVVKEWYPNKQLKFTKKYESGTLIEVVDNYNPDGTVVQ